MGGARSKASGNKNKNSSLVKNSDQHHSYRLIMVGNSKSGKTSLLTRFADGSFVDSDSKHSFEFKTKIVQADESLVRLMVWQNGMFFLIIFIQITNTSVHATTE
jgi:GTPase SAR1 family protein